MWIFSEAINETWVFTPHSKIGKGKIHRNQPGDTLELMFALIL